MDNGQNPFELGEAIYYSAVWLCAFVAGVVQTVRGTSYKSGWHTLAVGFYSGLLSFAVISLIDGSANDRDGYEFSYLGMAVIIGLSIDYQEQITRKLVQLAFKKIGIELTDDLEMPCEVSPLQPPIDPLAVCEVDGETQDSQTKDSQTRNA